MLVLTVNAHPCFYSSLHISTRSITRLMNLDGKPLTDLEIHWQTVPLPPQRRRRSSSSTMRRSSSSSWHCSSQRDGRRSTRWKAELRGSTAHQPSRPCRLFTGTNAATNCHRCCSNALQHNASPRAQRNASVAEVSTEEGCRLVFSSALLPFFYFWHQAFKDASLSKRMHLRLALLPLLKGSFKRFLNNVLINPPKVQRDESLVQTCQINCTIQYKIMKREHVGAAAVSMRHIMFFIL